MNENKQEICKRLCDLLTATRAGEDVIAVIYTSDGRDEWVTVHWRDKYQQKICVTADSGIALIQDVLRRI